MAVIHLFEQRALAAALVVGAVIYLGVQRYLFHRKIVRLGGYAPVIPSYVPFGLGFPYRAMKTAISHKVLEMWQSLMHECGVVKNGSYTFEFKVISARIIFTANVENIKAILATQFVDYGKGPKFHQGWEEFLGDSIFTTDGDQWQKSRSLIRPMFMRERVADLDLIEEHIEKLLPLIGPGDGRQISLDKLLSRYTLDAATHFLFGHSAGSLDDEESRFGRAFDEVQARQALIKRAGPLKVFMSKRSFKEGLKTMEEYMDPWILETLALTPAELDVKLSKSDTFIHSLARTTRDRKVIRDQLMSLLLAGRDTTAATLSWVFLELARNPNVVSKIQSEIQTAVGSMHTHPTYEQIKDMKYLAAVINETLRLYPPVPYNVRASLTDTTLPQGAGPDGMAPIGCPAGTIVSYSTLLMQRRRDLYPPISESFPYDPLDWVPERWATWTPKSWQFVPFNGGPRICIGQNFALTEMGYTVVRILQEFDSIIDYGNEMVLKTDILLTPANGVKIGLVKNSVRKEKA